MRLQTRTFRIRATRYPGLDGPPTIIHDLVTRFTPGASETRKREVESQRTNEES